MERYRVGAPARQFGKSAIGNLLVLALIAFGIWVGIQYIPQRIEAGAMRTMLDRVQQRHNGTPFEDDRDLWSVINAQLSVNDMRDMQAHVKTQWDQDAATVTVSYDRELNLIFTTKTMEYRETLVLHR